MPVLDGFEATKRIRAFEQEAWNLFSSSPPKAPSGLSSSDLGIREPIRRAVVIALVPGYAVMGLWQRVLDAGFDLSLSKPLSFGSLSSLLFSGPRTNAVSVYGGVDEETLVEAGYPLQIRPCKRSGTGERAVAEVLGQAVA
jgi:CheY-like chemotaxis protein